MESNNFKEMVSYLLKGFLCESEKKNSRSLNLRRTLIFIADNRYSTHASTFLLMSCLSWLYPESISLLLSNCYAFLERFLSGFRLPSPRFSFQSFPSSIQVDSRGQRAESTLLFIQQMEMCRKARFLTFSSEFLQK